MIRILLCALFVGLCAGFCSYSSDCKYKGHQLMPGTTMYTIGDCMKCRCSVKGELSCCSDGKYYVEYPKHCKVVKDYRGCQRLVMKKGKYGYHPPCVGGIISAVGR